MPVTELQRRKTAIERMADPSTQDVTIPASLLDALKLYLGIDPGDNTQDVELTNALTIAVASIETYLDRVIIKQEVTEYFPHHWGTVVLHDPQVDTSASVTVLLNGVAQTGYDIFLMRGRVAHLTRTDRRPDTPMDWRTYDQVDVTYTAGYDPLPADITQAICYTAALINESTGTGNIPGGGGSGEVKSMSIYDVGSISYDVGSSSGSGGDGMFSSMGIIPDTAASMLSRYKRMGA